MLPNRPWIVFGEFSWLSTVDKPKWGLLAGHWDAAMSHLPVLAHYDVDQVSLVDAYIPVGMNRTLFLNRWIMVDKAHPSHLGHQIIAQILAHALMEESPFMNLPPHEN